MLSEFMPINKVLFRIIMHHSDPSTDLLALMSPVTGVTDFIDSFIVPPYISENNQSIHALAVLHCGEVACLKFIDPALSIRESLQFDLSHPVPWAGWTLCPCDDQKHWPPPTLHWDEDWSASIQ